MREQYVSDGIEHFDFHVAKAAEAERLSKAILSGEYSPQRPQRILVEKSKGMCRQLVIPSVRDAIVLQCLSDALYADIHGKAPTKNAFYQPKDHRFSTIRSEYGTFASWLNFQKELFNFSKTRNFVIVTDIANYYDSISYVHLRNVISSVTGAEECIIDMLIYVLSDLLWQPDYTPRIEVGLPQINLDAPRLLAHCFLYELDSFLASDPNRDFVRFMDDVDIGVDSIVQAKKTLKDIDLVLQTKQIRLNSGKTSILSRNEALRHFRVFENSRLDSVSGSIERKIKAGLPIDREKNLVEIRISRGLKKKVFDQGNGEKVLKRWINLAAKTGANIEAKNMESIIKIRPNVRETVFGYIRSLPLTPNRAKVLSSCAVSGLLVDDAALVDLSNNLNETLVKRRAGISSHIQEIIASFDPKTFYGFYCSFWLQSKYAAIEELFEFIAKHRIFWVSNERLGRLVGSVWPLFAGTTQEKEVLDIIQSSPNSGVVETYRFQRRLMSEKKTFDSMYNALRNPNPSRGTSITHSKFLCLTAALQNDAALLSRRTALRRCHDVAFSDIYYKTITRRLGIY
jgi:hypothetical protein